MQAFLGSSAVAKGLWKTGKAYGRETPGESEEAHTGTLSHSQAIDHLEHLHFQPMMRPVIRMA